MFVVYARVCDLRIVFGDVGCQLGFALEHAAIVKELLSPGIGLNVDFSSGTLMHFSIRFMVFLCLYLNGAMFTDFK